MEVDLESDEQKSPDRVDLTSINLEFDPTAKCCCVARVSVMRVLLSILSGATLVIGCLVLSDAGDIKNQFTDAGKKNQTTKDTTIDPEFVCVCCAVLCCAVCVCVRVCLVQYAD